MFIANPGMPVAIVIDTRMRSDRDLDISEPKETHVLHLWRLGRQALGSRYYHTTRIALFDVGYEPSKFQVALKRMDLLQYLNRYVPERLIVLPTPDAQSGERDVTTKGTVAWAALKAPDSLGAMRLTRWARGPTEVMAGYPVARRTKELHLMAMAEAMGRVDEAILAPRALHADLDETTPAVLEAMRGRNLAIDLEFIPSSNTITAINLSDGIQAVSLPFDTYLPRGQEERVDALCSTRVGERAMALIRELLAADTVKYCHNFVADVPRLQGRGLKVGGRVHDTFAAHAIAYPELPHGLQAAAASVLPVPPWKSTYKPQGGEGYSAEDIEYWTSDPYALRMYGAQDAFYTYHLAQKVLPLVGFDPTGGRRL